MAGSVILKHCSEHRFAEWLNEWLKSKPKRLQNLQGVQHVQKLVTTLGMSKE